MSSQSLRYPGLLLFSALFSVVLLLGVTLPGHSRLINALQDSGHFLIFTLLSLAVLWSYKTKTDKYFWPILLGCLLFGAVMEIVQYTIGREASLYDLLMNAMGVTSGGLLFSGMIRRSIPRGLSVLAAVLLFVIAFSGPLYWLFVSQVRNADFPILVNLEGTTASAFLQGSNGGDVRIINRPTNWPADIAADQERCAIVLLEEGAWPGVSLIEPEPDWRGYQSLELSLYSEQQRMLPLSLRINDRTHNNKFKDRFNQRLELSYGYNRFTIPLKEIENSPSGRRMDLSTITNLLIFGTKRQIGSEFYLLSMRLR
ncbi:MAG: VanZ family protein [Candidatus Thiodiazotropha sp. (ex Ustalcina ferruginea)]|nr:VanZ family protein [Candidatus Thiodiazotropha sp. (ex Ustalcina ferruginea)]